MQHPVISIIVAVARNGVIGRDGKMPWHNPSELAYFKATTMGKPIIMGRKTYQSIGRALPGRRNIVVTRDRGFSAAGVETVASLDAAIARATVPQPGAAAPDEIMIIGGGQIYAEALPRAARVYLTRIDASPEGDATFPPLDPARWRESTRRDLPQGPKDQFPATVFIYDRVA
ncbi:MAG TPA: dihydrofolate reductase [Hyphomicrobiaceae bacterium]|nr:dihydrofolate reductase [Hyphomicrobiaceae bacterium]